jgi:hypothetical protein
LTIRQAKEPAKNLALYLRVKWSRCGVLRSSLLRQFAAGAVSG